MLMTNFNRFQERNRQLLHGREHANQHFVFSGYNSTRITNIGGDGESKSQVAAVVSRQEKDCAYVYTKINEPLEIGSVWHAKGLHLLITEEIVVIKDVEWKKYNAILCNVEVENTWGWFKGPEERWINVSLKQDVLLQSQQHPILVLPEGTLQIGDKIAIKNRGWLVQEEDSISTEGISYYSIRSSALSKETIEANKDKEVFVEKDKDIVAQLPEEEEVITKDEDVIRYVYPTTENEIATEDGYFVYSNKQLKVLSKSATKVVFMLPFSVCECEIKVKENGEEKVYTYRHAEEE